MIPGRVLLVGGSDLVEEEMEEAGFRPRMRRCGRISVRAVRRRKGQVHSPRLYFSFVLLLFSRGPKGVVSRSFASTVSGRKENRDTPL